MNQKLKSSTPSPIPNLPALFKLSSLFTAIIACNLANAQTTNSNPSEEELQSVERIVVTADLSQRDLSELPASVNVLNQAIIEARQARHLQDLLGVMPNVNFSSGASRGKFIQIRGIGERSQFAEPVNPSIGILLDDIDISGIGGLATLYDLRQVEVLSGPQSVSSGINSMGGIVKLVSNTPSATTYAKFDASYGQYNESQLGATISGALSDNINARFSAQQVQSDGFVRNDFLNRDNTNGIDETTATLVTTISLNDKSDLAVNVYKFDIDNGYDAFSLDNTVTLSDQPGFDKLDAIAGSLKYSYRLDKHKLQLTAYSLSVDTKYGFDEDWTFVGIHPDGYSSIDLYDRSISRMGVDFKFASTAKAGENSYLLGANITQHSEDLVRQNTYLTDDYLLDYKPTNRSVFGQYVFALNEKAKLTSAARIEKFEADFEDYQGLTTINDTLVAASLALDYQLANNLLFASISRGYKAGGFNIDERLSADNRIFDPEYNVNYELGIKGEAFDGIANLNLSFFYMDRDDAQVDDSVLFAIDGSGASSFADAKGNANTGINKGIELSATWDVLDNWYLQTNLGYLDATFGGYTKLNGDFVEVQQQAHAPEYTAYASSTWQISPNLIWFFDVDIKDKYRLGVNHDVRSPSSIVLNTELSWHSQGEHLYSIKLWVKNITDEQIVTRGFGSFPNDPRDGYSTFGPYFQFGQVRQLGISFRYEWE